jgi:predicted NBD/HSP70 family sugar kinase
MLVDDGFLVEQGIAPQSALGRPSELLEVVPSARHFVGIKLTGDHMYSVVTNLAATIVDSMDEPLVSRQASDVVNQVAAAVAGFKVKFADLTAVGVTLAGVIHRIDGEQVVVDSHFLGWTNVPLARMVSEETGLSTATENDVQALTAAEHWFGAGAGLDTMALFTVGVGIGCGLIVNGNLVEGAHGLPGRASHLIVDQNGPLCDMGHRGCATAFLTNDAIVAAAAAGRSHPRDYESALEHARSGDSATLDAFRHAGFALGSIIGTVSNIVDPEKVILTGDGLALYGLAQDEVWRGISATFQENISLIDLDVQGFDFSEWARSGAVLGIRTVAA